MLIHINEIGGDIVRNDDRYVVRDNKFLKNLVLSSTDLKPGKSTGGHSHAGQEEVYYFVSGYATMELKQGEDLQMLPVGPGDVVLIPDGAFHRVHNKSETENCYFVCVFDGKRNH